MFGEKGENRVSTPLVLSIRQYAHISQNHTKRGHFIKYAIYFKKPYAHSIRSYQSIRHIQLVKIIYIKRPTILSLVKPTCIST